MLLLSDDDARALVAAETLEHRVAQLPVGRPLCEADVGDELRLDPVNPCSEVSEGRYRGSATGSDQDGQHTRSPNDS